MNDNRIITQNDMLAALDAEISQAEGMRDYYRRNSAEASARADAESSIAYKLRAIRERVGSGSALVEAAPEAIAAE